MEASMPCPINMIALHGSYGSYLSSGLSKLLGVSRGTYSYSMHGCLAWVPSTPPPPLPSRFHSAYFVFFYTMQARVDAANPTGIAYLTSLT